MEAKDLRINNIVGATLAGNVTASELDFSDFDKKLFEKYGFVSHKIENGIDIDNAKWYFPIPLTEEWLLKLGFRWSDNYNWFAFDKPYIVFKKDFTLFNEPFGIEIKLEYVHELQNLFFALSGIELEIKIEIEKL